MKSEIQKTKCHFCKEDGTCRILPSKETCDWALITPTPEGIAERITLLIKENEELADQILKLKNPEEIKPLFIKFLDQNSGIKQLNEELTKKETKNIQTPLSYKLKQTKMLLYLKKQSRATK